jgi:energy-coupling factor transporter ATP-binding protein EcfA2
MRLKSITIRNYRVHHDVTVLLDDSRTLIGGPNECGKSTLVEAIHRVLFLKSKVTGDIQKSMVSTWFDGSPEVEVGFTVGNSDYVLAKRFSGNTGTTRLVQVGGETWHGENAETRLACLLKVEAVGGGKGVGERVVQQWSHLWVWQGQSGSDPSAHANLQRDGLLQRLQQTGGAAALQSEMDAQLAARFAVAKDEIFTQAGKPKTGSDLEKAKGESNQAETNRQRAAERVEKLREAVRDFEDATQAIARATDDLRQLNQQKDAVEAKLSRVDELRRQEAIQLPDATTAAGKYQALKKSDRHISELRDQIQTLQGDLQPKNEQTRLLEECYGSTKQHSGEAVQAYELAANRTRDSRLRRDLAAACVARFEKDARLQELLVRDGQVRGHQDQLAHLREKLARLPEVTAPRLKKLHKLETELNQSEAALKAMAAGIEVLSASEPVRVGNASLAVGQSQVVTEQTEIVVGESLRLRISPGGGASLQEARNNAQESRRELLEQLDELGIPSVSDAAEALAGRNDLAGKISNADAALEGLDAANLPAALAEAREAAAAAVAEVEHRSPQVRDFTPPSTLADAKPRLATEDLTVEEAESGEAQTKKIRDAEAKAFTSAEKALSDHRIAIAQQNHELIGLNAQLQLLVQTYGEEAPRAVALAEALAAKDSAEELLSSTRQALADLQPDLLAKDRGRLKRACDGAGDTKRAAENKRLEAQVALRSDGTDDPEAALALAVGRTRSAQDHLASVSRKADAIKLLNELFLEEQRTLAEQFTKPFAERISTYLQCLFGPGARATVILADNAFTGLQLVRPSQGGGATSFDALSGGAREQVAAAVRLAMAEVLAADHDGCLPLVFDDAFAYSDPERVQILQRMLDLAASNGLQLIILTCNPSDYAALGARQVSLRPESSSSASQRAIATAGSSETSGETAETEIAPANTATEATAPATLVTEERRDQLLFRLRELGGKAGNLSLREALGWDEATYNAVKDDLMSSATLIPGKGRGGSVALPDQ